MGLISDILGGGDQKIPAPAPIAPVLPPNILRLSDAALTQIRGQGVGASQLRIGNGPISTEPSNTGGLGAKAQNFFKSGVGFKNDLRMGGRERLNFKSGFLNNIFKKIEDKRLGKGTSSSSTTGDGGG